MRKAKNMFGRDVCQAFQIVRVVLCAFSHLRGSNILL